jgi:hypothetical protein
MDRCKVPRCRAEASITYLGHGVCERHWNQLTADEASPSLRQVLGISESPVAATEEAMEPTTSKTSKIEPQAVSTKKAKAPKKEKATKREKVENPVVFAFRLDAADRDKIHAAAGPAGATRFVRSAALAAATADLKGFEALIAQAKANTK